MNGPVTHPAGCRCPGCLPGQYVMRPASPRPAVSHARQPQPGSGGVGILLPAAVILAVVAGGGFWPALVWHGEGGPDGTTWEPTGGTVVACCVWWVFLAVCVAGWRLTKTERWARWSEAANTAPSRPQPPPPCAHAGAVPVDNDGLGRLAWWCPECETQLDPGFRASELSPDASWPPVRKRPL